MINGAPATRYYAQCRLSLRETSVLAKVVALSVRYFRGAKGDHGKSVSV